MDASNHPIYHPAASYTGDRRARRRRRWDEESDAALVASAATGEEGAWRELHRRYDRVVRSIASRLGCGAATADVSQRTWEELVRSLGCLRDPSRVVGWSATTARHEALRVLMRQRPVPVQDGEYASGVTRTRSPEALVIEKETICEVDEAVSALPSTYRELIARLLDDDTPSYQDLAASLGRSVGSIGPMRGRGMRLLKHQLALAGTH